MGQCVIRQPDGRLAVWSSVVDDFVILDATPEEIVEEWAADAADRARETARAAIARAVETGSSSRGMGPSSWEDALEMRREAHEPEPEEQS